MKKIGQRLRANRRKTLIGAAALLVVSFLLLYRLGTLVGGLSLSEVAAAREAVGWHGIYNQPFYLPLKALRSIVFFAFSDHGALLTRLPNAFFGLVAIASFAWLVKLWHGTRTAVLASCLFATSAWVLHVSRLASFDVMYLCAVPLLLVTHLKLQKASDSAVVFYGSLVVWGLLLYIPGMIWLLLINVIASRKSIAAGWRHFNRWWQRLAYLLIGIGWLPLLTNYIRNISELKVWLGLSVPLDGPLLMLKQFAGVFVHLFVRGPQNPELWLGRAPLLDVFTLAVCLVGIYFYARHVRLARSRLLATFFLVGAVLIALGGTVSLSLLVPIVYLLAATGIAYLLREWLQTFPRNPLARGLGVSLVVIAVALSCTYNLRAYFVAWPHNSATQIIFRYYP